MNMTATLRVYARPVCRTFLPLLAAVLLVAGPVSSVHAKEKKKNKAAEAQVPSSHRFFAFDDAPYYTSPDKRIGVKMLIDSAKVGPTLTALQHLTMLPTAAIKSHRHVYVTEAVYVLKGNLTLRIEKEVKVMGPNSVAYIPPQTFHEYLNDSGDVVEFLQYYSPSGPEEEYRNWERPDAPKKAVQTAAAEPATPTAIVRPPLPPVPGSPQPLLGAVHEEQPQTDAVAPMTTPDAIKAAPVSRGKLEFKLKQATGTVKLDSPVRPTTTSSK
ncbi:cupin domain-containing protein [Candidatus Ozemobacteraceae bacterium]|nr:cupin domain-containing protein [Candidatus Ozemobacteraceae bacterium]